jgi:hypothetical protein
MLSQLVYLNCSTLSGVHIFEQGSTLGTVQDASPPYRFKMDHVANHITVFGNAIIMHEQVHERIALFATFWQATRTLYDQRKASMALVKREPLARVSGRNSTSTLLTFIKCLCENNYMSSHDWYMCHIRLVHMATREATHPRRWWQRDIIE